MRNNQKTDTRYRDLGFKERKFHENDLHQRRSSNYLNPNQIYLKEERKPIMERFHENRPNIPKYPNINSFYNGSGKERKFVYNY